MTEIDYTKQVPTVRPGENYRVEARLQNDGRANIYATVIGGNVPFALWVRDEIKMLLDHLALIVEEEAALNYARDPRERNLAIAQKLLDDHGFTDLVAMDLGFASSDASA